MDHLDGTCASEVRRRCGSVAPEVRQTQADFAGRCGRQLLSLLATS
eukprot:CAMPEP_0194543742 /NCGR_PEP_ID=MMETSP0253-20130528/86340_1 /TAXON_ID=2966 /ORGANISM="Noctiluca scintillans" /LENGTH=45 /DNA_ID= /DNA_START= /DNA_END= /DNA_ORIENTATION=